LEAIIAVLCSLRHIRFVPKVVIPPAGFQIESTAAAAGSE
jgi:hypothetical protein